MFQTSLCRKSKHVSFSVTFFRKSCSFLAVEKDCRVGQTKDGNMANAHCMLDTQGYIYTHNIHYCFSTARTVMLTRFCYIILNLPVLFLQLQIQQATSRISNFTGHFPPPSPSTPITTHNPLDNNKFIYFLAFFLEWLTLENGTDRLFRRRYTTDAKWATTQKSWKTFRL
jgi:hypothetical protein